jgi:hypothetical protein
MKKSELLQLIREEIENVINEMPTSNTPVWRHGEKVEVDDEGYIGTIDRPTFIEVYKVTPDTVYYIDDAWGEKSRMSAKKWAINATFQRTKKDKSKKPKGKLD